MVARSSFEPAKGGEIFERIFFSESSPMSTELAKHFLAIEIPKENQARMADLLLRNQSNLLSPAEENELQNYSQAGTILAIFQSQARRVLKVAPPKPRRKNGHG